MSEDLGFCENSRAAYDKWLEDQEIPEIRWERVSTLFGKYRLMGPFRGTPEDEFQMMVSANPSTGWVTWGGPYLGFGRSAPPLRIPGSHFFKLPGKLLQGIRAGTPC